MEDIWDGRAVYIKSMYGWTPELWGCVTFSNSTRPKTLIKRTSDPFIMVSYRSTRLDGDKVYPNFESALAGEESIKNYLGAHGKWLGGEFYAATEDIFEKAWQAGRETALKYASRQKQTNGQ